ncbi:lipopolysaccharide biosynthesis protein [Pelosinus baikalensis]|uniref:Oligosaccharide flippase family protein n=1 Tax=Pelosinus baikalensis TaxID=2892015 RepID=A0ABS8HLS4_9FIRM|nr:oligosaccharide flippase family protein [Pelosinus baikalensis]MCC5464089.1 oligosaccharide flippase family protein [Pelosinus baikalensis]
MTRNIQLLKNTVIYFIGNFSSSLLSFLFLPLYTRYLSPEDYGKIDIIFAFSFIVSPIITMQVSFACYRYLLDAQDDRARKTIISNTLAVTLTGYLCFILAYELLNSLVYIEFSLAIMLYVLLGGMALLVQTLARGFKENILYSVLGVVSTIVLLAGNIVFIIGLNLKSLALLLSPVCANVMVIFIGLYKLRLIRFFDVKLINKKSIKELLTYSAPLVPDAVCWWLLFSFGRVFLNYYYSAAEVGILAVANKFPTALTSLYSIFALAWKENAIAEYDSPDRDEYYSDIYNRQIVVILCGILILLPATRLSIEFILDPSYQAAYQYIPLLFMSSALSMMAGFWGSGFESAQKTSGIMISTLYAFVVNALINIILVPAFSIYGVAIANIAAFATLYSIRVIRSRPFFTITTDKRRIIPLLSFTIIFCFLYYVPNMLLQGGLVCSSIVIFFIYHRQIVHQFMQYMRVLIQKRSMQL